MSTTRQPESPAASPQSAQLRTIRRSRAHSGTTNQSQQFDFSNATECFLGRKIRETSEYIYGTGVYAPRSGLPSNSSVSSPSSSSSDEHASDVDRLGTPTAAQTQGELREGEHEAAPYPEHVRNEDIIDRKRP